ncbi:MAG: hypothetical protein ACREFJ_14505, partial [Acetobacteraceae bacterium]
RASADFPECWQRDDAAAGRAAGRPRARPAHLAVWALTLPRVAATLAAALVAHAARRPGGAALLDDQMLNVVLVMVLATPILGPVLIERFAPRLRGNVAALRR